jgi:hypothetical protein
MQFRRACLPILQSNLSKLTTAINYQNFNGLSWDCGSGC